VFINTAHLHRNPAYWDRPNEFLPDRWTHTNVNNNPWSAFGMGRRVCAGRRFAETEIRTMIAWLFSTYHVELVEAGEVLTFITMRPEGLQVKLTKLAD
jgi:cytochrome P450